MTEVAKVFDAWARGGRDEGMETGHGQTAAPVLAALPVEQGTRFLDLGCGNGWAARQAAARGAVATGIDASPEMVIKARALAESADLSREPGNRVSGASFRVGDFAKLPWDDGAFDVVWSMEAVYYAPEPDVVLAEVRRVLAPDGVFHMLIDHYQENPASHSWPEDTGVPMALRSAAQWLAAFEAAGFTGIREQRLRATAPDAEAWKREQGTLHIVGRP